MNQEIKDPVNLSLGDKLSAYAGRKTRETHDNSIWVKVEKPDGHFRSEVEFDILSHIADRKIIIAPDGIGTKVAIIDAALGHKNAARDLIAMTAGDITRFGGCPVAFSNVLDVSSLGENDKSLTYVSIQSMFDGLVEVANELKFACIKGETAELSVCVSSPNPSAVVKFNWAGFMIGISHKNKRINGETLAPGQIVVALREYGFRSNGISAVRTTLQNQFGDLWWDNNVLVNQVSVPSKLYDSFFIWLNGWQNIDNNFEQYLKPHLICHLSGGSFKAKFFDDILKRKGLSANLPDLWHPPTIVENCARWSGMNDEQLYEKWNCGQGALVVLDKADVHQFIKYANQFDIEAKVCGEIIKTDTPKLQIVSQFSGNRFSFT